MPDSRSGDPGSKASTTLIVPAGAPVHPLEKFIIVTGTPGVGKTVLARLLARETHSDTLQLGRFVKQRRLYRSYDPAARSYTIDEKQLHSSLTLFFDSHRGKRLVVETHWLGRFMPKRAGMVAVVVRLDPIVLAKRLKRRGWPKLKVWENVEAELIDLSLYESIKFLGEKRVVEINATRKRPQMLLREAMRLLSSGRGWNGLTPNWLERYDPIELSRKIL